MLETILLILFKVFITSIHGFVIHKLLKLSNKKRVDLLTGKPK